MRMLLFAACLLPTLPALAEDFVCPIHLDAATAEWQLFPASMDVPALTGMAVGIELYAGEPGNGAPIADDSSGQIGVAPLAWTLRGQPLSMACVYAGTEQRLVRPLPAGLRHCQANNEFEDQHLQLECR